MLRIAFLFLSVGLVFGLAGRVSAEEKDKDVKLEGTVCCAKCELSLTDKCATVIKVKDKDKKDVIYYFDPAGDKKFHGKICNDAKEGTVTGTVKKDGDKMIITVKTCEFK
jgi:uncharacterized protein (DUF2147 family)